MRLHALLTLDLPGADAAERIAFYAALRDLHWHKVPGVSTGWTATFREGMAAEDALREASVDLAHAARAAGDIRHHAVVLVSPHQPVRL